MIRNCHDVFLRILGKWPTWRTILFYVFIFIYNSLHVSSTSCSLPEETNCVNTTSGNCHSVSVSVSSADDTATDTEWQLPEVVLTQFVSPGDKHDVLETCRVINKHKYIEKNCASRWSFTKNIYMMHGQQNIKCCLFEGLLNDSLYLHISMDDRPSELGRTWLRKQL